MIPWYLISRYVGKTSGNNSHDMFDGIYHVFNFQPEKKYIDLPDTYDCAVDTDRGTLTGYTETGKVLYEEDIVNLVKDIPIEDFVD